MTKSRAVHLAQRIGAVIRRCLLQREKSCSLSSNSVSTQLTVLFNEGLHGYALAYFTGLSLLFCLYSIIFCYVIPLERCKSFLPLKLLRPGTISLPLSTGKSLNCFPRLSTCSIVHWIETRNWTPGTGGSGTGLCTDYLTSFPAGSSSCGAYLEHKAPRTGTAA